MAGAAFTTSAELAQAHAQAGTRAGGWAEGIGSSATAVNSLAGVLKAFVILPMTISFFNLSSQVCLMACRQFVHSLVSARQDLSLLSLTVICMIMYFCAIA